MRTFGVPFWLLTLLFASAPALAAGVKKKCFYVNSYAPGEAWADGVIHGLKRALGDACLLKRYDMDTRIKNKSAALARRAGDAAFAEIVSWKPDVVIVSDDMAAKFVLAAHLRNASTPVVFTGVNLPGDGYGLPYENATGMFEIPPFEIILQTVQGILPAVSKGVCFTHVADAPYLRCQRLIRAAARMNIELEDRRVRTVQDLEKAYRESKRTGSEFFFMQTIQLGEAWDFEKIAGLAAKYPHVLTVTDATAAKEAAMISILEDSEEFGAYAGQVAVKILSGAKPKEFTVVTNKRWRTLIKGPLMSHFRAWQRSVDSLTNTKRQGETSVSRPSRDVN